MMATAQERFNAIAADVDRSTSGELTGTQKGELRSLRASAPELASAIDILLGTKPTPQSGDKFAAGIERGRAAARREAEGSTYPILGGDA